MGEVMKDVRPYRNEPEGMKPIDEIVLGTLPDGSELVAHNVTVESDSSFDWLEDEEGRMTPREAFPWLFVFAVTPWLAIYWLVWWIGASCAP